MRLRHLYEFPELTGDCDFGGIWETLRFVGSEEDKSKRIWTIRRVMVWDEKQKLRTEKVVPQEIIEDYGRIIVRHTGPK